MDSSVYNVCCHVWCTHLLNHSRGADQKLLLKELKPADSLWLYPLFMEVELSAHCKNHQWSKSSLGGWSTCFSSCNDTYFCQCRNLQIEKLGFFFTEPFSWLSLSGVRKWLCTCAQLPSVFLVSSVLLKAIRSLLFHQSRYQSSSCLCCLHGAGNIVCQTSCVGILHGFVGARMGFGDCL